MTTKCSTIYIPDNEVFATCPYDNKIKHCKDPHACDKCEAKDEYDKEQEKENEAKRKEA